MLLRTVSINVKNISTYCSDKSKLSPRVSMIIVINPCKEEKA